MFLSFKCISDFPPFISCHQHSIGCHKSSCLVLVTVFLLTFLHTSLKHLLCLPLLNRSLLSPAWNSDYCALFKASWGLVCFNSALCFLLSPVNHVRYPVSCTLLLVVSRSVLSDPAIPWTAACQASLTHIDSEFAQTHIHWVGDACHSTVFSSVSSFSFYYLQSFPELGSFPVSRLVASGGPSIGASASASVLPVNIQGWFPLGLTGLISLLSKGLSRLFSSTTVQKHKFFSA